MSRLCSTETAWLSWQTKMFRARQPTNFTTFHGVNDGGYSSAGIEDPGERCELHMASDKGIRILVTLSLESVQRMREEGEFANPGLPVLTCCKLLTLKAWLAVRRGNGSDPSVLKCCIKVLGISVLSYR